MFGGFAAIAALAGIIWLMFWSPLLDVREVKVVGAKETSASAVIDASGLIDSAPNLLLLSTTEVVEAIETLPWVAEVEVDRMLPGTVRVRIEEREPALVLSLGRARWTLDAQGNVLTGGEAVKGLPVLDGIEVGGVEPGTRLVTGEARSALKVLDSLPRSIRDRLAGISAPTIELISLELTDGTEIRFGAAERLAAKNEVTKALLAKIKAEGRSVAYIDVRVPANAAVKDKPAPR
jgi:cell division protein FtsQ